MKVLVTGSEGFIGKKLVEELKKRNHEVFGFDLDSGQNLLNKKHLDLVEEAEAVIHLAALLDEKTKMEYLKEVNVKGTEKLLEKCVQAKVKKFIYLSTTGVMGDIKAKADELTELNPKTPYEKTKAEAEKKVNEFQELLPVTILRSALVLGPNKYWKEIIKLIKKGFPLIGKGNNTFQIVYYKDLVSAIIFCIEKEETEGETFIIAEKEGKSLLQIYKLIQKELGIEKQVKHLPVFLAKTFSFIWKGIVTKEHIDRLIRERNYSTEKIEKLGWKANYST
ncbi:NAD(P)-dependent oxidoreductase, partial [Candidatus Micrarchaeota archaeon]|nr:NAD(P)-dependent oxidoreductase [Candidatus Micrarchaeota archaeon]